MSNAKNLAALVKMIERAYICTLNGFSRVVEIFHARGAVGVENSAPWIPYEQRPVICRQNPNVILLSSRGLTGYYIEPRDRTVVVVFTDRIVRFSYDDTEGFQSAISDLEYRQFRRIDFRRGAAKAFVVFGVVVFLLEVVAVFSQIQW